MTDLPDRIRGLSLDSQGVVDDCRAAGRVLVYAATRALGEMRAWSGTFRDSQADSTVEAMESLRSALDPFLLDDDLTEEQGLLYDQNWRDDRYAQVQALVQAAIYAMTPLYQALVQGARGDHDGAIDGLKLALEAMGIIVTPPVVRSYGAIVKAAKSGGGAGE